MTAKEIFERIGTIRNNQLSELKQWEFIEKLFVSFKDDKQIANLEYAILKLESLYYYITRNEGLYDHCISILDVRAKVYATDKDRFENFRRAGRMTNENFINMILFIGSKHFAAIEMRVEEDNYNPELLPHYTEIFGDAINYLILLILFHYN